MSAVRTHVSFMPAHLHACAPAACILEFAKSLDLATLFYEVLTPVMAGHGEIAAYSELVKHRQEGNCRKAFYKVCR